MTKERDKQIEKYLKEKKKAEKSRRRVKVKRIKQSQAVKDYAVDEFPERRALKKAAGFLVSRAKKIKKTKQRATGAKAGEQSGQEQRQQRLVWMLDKGITIAIYVSLLGIPLFFLPASPSLIEASKQLFLIILTGIIILFWLAKMVVADRVEIKKSFLLVPITVFVLVYAFSTIFSLYPNTSLWGAMKGESVSFLSLLVCVAYFYGLTNNVAQGKPVRRLLLALLFSSFLASIYATLQIHGLHLIEGAKVEERTINSVGTIWAAAVYFAGMAVLAAGLAAFSPHRRTRLAYFVFALGFLAFLSTCFFQKLGLIFTLAAGLMLAVSIAQRKTGKTKGSIGLPVLVFSFALFSLLLGRPLWNSGVDDQEILMSFSKSREVTTQSIKENPFWGSGPGTFYLNYERFRPDMGQFSVLGINQPMSYFILILATTGLLTIAAYLFLLFVLSRFAIANIVSVMLGRHQRGDFMTAAVGIFWLYLTAAGLIYLNNMLLLFAWWFALAIIDINRPVHSVFAASSEPLPTKKKRRQVFRVDFYKISLVVSLLLVVYLAFFAATGFIAIKRYAAAYYYQTAIDYNGEGRELPEILPKIERAVELDDKRDLYWRNMAVIFFANAKERISNAGQNFSGEDSKQVSASLNKAIAGAERAIKLNPYDFENYRNLAWIYQEMSGMTASFGEKSLDYYKQALDYSPRNPDIFYQLADLYVDLYSTEVSLAAKEKKEPGPKAQEYLLSAEENLRRALELRPEHFGANILLVTVYDLLGDQEHALAWAQHNWEAFWGNGQAGFSLATQYYKQEKYDQAIEILEAIIKERPEYSNARYLLGYCLAQKGELDRSLEEFEKVQLRNPNNEQLTKIIENLRNGKTDFLSD